MMRPAFSSLPSPRAMEKRGEPPVEQRDWKALMTMRMGAAMPMPVRASLPPSAMWPM